MLQALAVPSAAFEPRFRGSFRSLVYTRAGVAETQEMMAYKVRRTYRHTQTDKIWMLMNDAFFIALGMVFGTNIDPFLVLKVVSKTFCNHCFFLAKALLNRQPSQLK